MALARRFLSVAAIVVVVLGHAGFGLQPKRAKPDTANFPSFEEFSTSVAINQIAILDMMQECSHASRGIAERELRRQDEAAERDARLQKIEEALENLKANVQNATEETANGIEERELRRQDESAERDARLQKIEAALENLKANVQNATEETANGVAAQLAALRQEMMSEVMSLLKIENNVTSLPEMESTVTSPPEVPELATCPDGWQRRESSCYLFANDGRHTWADCQAYCRGLGGDLAKITSAQEHEFIATHLGARLAYWIGLNDRAREGHFVWTDGSAPTYTRWGEGEPNDCCGGEDCVYMYKHGNYKWNDSSCSGTKYGGCVCERAVHA